MSQSVSTKDKIIAAARQLFVEHGFAGVSIGTIARLANVKNHSLIIHHFHSKENLWMEVKQVIACDSIKISEVLPKTDLAFPLFIKSLFKNTMLFYKKNPEIVRMISWQRFEPNLVVTRSPHMIAWIDAFKYYQKNGEVRKNIKPEFIVAMILSILSSAVMDRYFFTADKKGMNSYTSFACDAVMRAVQL